MISLTFPGLRVAMTSRSGIRTAARTLNEPGERLALEFGELLDSILGQAQEPVQLLAGKRPSLGRALDLDELPLAGHDHVEVDLSLRVFLVAEVEQQLLADEAAAHRGHRVDDDVPPQRAGFQQAADRLRERQIAGGDGGGP